MKHFRRASIVSRLKGIAIPFYETFNRTNSSTLGNKWLDIRGSWGISSNQASTSTAASSYPLSTLTFTKDSVTLGVSGVGPAVGTAFWVTDANNWWGTYIDTRCSTCANTSNPASYNTTQTGGGNYASGGNCNSFNASNCNSFNASNCASYSGGNCASGSTVCTAYSYVCNAYATNTGNCASYSQSCTAYNNPSSCASYFRFCSAYNPGNTYCSASSTPCNAYGYQCNAYNPTVCASYNPSYCNSYNPSNCNAYNPVVYNPLTYTTSVASYNAVTYYTCNCDQNNDVKIIKMVAGVVSTVATLSFNGIIRSLKTAINASTGQISVTAYSAVNYSSVMGSTQNYTATSFTANKVHGIIKGPITYSPAETSVIDDFQAEA